MNTLVTRTIVPETASASSLEMQSAFDALNLALMTVAVEHEATIRFKYIKRAKREAGDLIPEVRNFTPSRTHCSVKGNWTGGGMDLDRDEYHNYSIVDMVGTVEFVSAANPEALNLHLMAVAALHNCAIRFSYVKEAKKKARNAIPEVRNFAPEEVRCSQEGNWTGYGIDTDQSRPSYFSVANIVGFIGFTEVGEEA